jgi:hypothetical protein
VILDGDAGGDGDPARGARHNSAVRYLRAATEPTVIVIVSEDGGIDVFPHLRPRIMRADVEAALQQLRMVASGEFDPEAFHRAWNGVKALAFYMNARQCEEANLLHEAHEERRWSEYQMKLSFEALAPNLDMNDSYFLDG